MQILDLRVERRDKLGSANSRRYRRAGRIPCVLYGRGQDNVNLTTDAHAFGGVLKSHGALVRLALGEETQTALIREVIWDTLGEYVEHIDLVRVEMEDQVTIKVPLHFVGIPVGVGEGGELEIILHDLEVACRVDAIPGEIRVDVTGLLLHQGLHIGELSYPDGVQPVGHAEELVVHVVPPRKAEEPKPEEGEVPLEGEAAAAPAEGAKPETESED